MKVRTLGTALLLPLAMSPDAIVSLGRELEIVIFPADEVVEIGSRSHHVHFENFDSSQGVTGEYLFVSLMRSIGGCTKGYFDAHSVELLVD